MKNLFFSKSSVTRSLAVALISPSAHTVIIRIAQGSTPFRYGRCKTAANHFSSLMRTSLRPSKRSHSKMWCSWTFPKRTSSIAGSIPSFINYKRLCKVAHVHALGWLLVFSTSVLAVHLSIPFFELAVLSNRSITPRGSLICVMDANINAFVAGQLFQAILTQGFQSLVCYSILLAIHCEN